MAMSCLTFTLIIASLSSVQNSAWEWDSSFTSAEILSNKIDAGVHFLCSNQDATDGRFLSAFELQLRDGNHIATHMHNEDINMQHQCGAFYSVAMHYRFHQRNMSSSSRVQVIDCITKSVQFLRDNLIPSKGADSATSVAVLGMIELCISDDTLCQRFLETFISWIKTVVNHYGGIDDAESYLAVVRLVKYQQYLFRVVASTDPIWEKINDALLRLDVHFLHRDRHMHTSTSMNNALVERWLTLSNNWFLDNFMISHMKHLMMDDDEIAMRNLAMYADVMRAAQSMLNRSVYIYDADHDLYRFANRTWRRIRDIYADLQNSQLQFSENEIDAKYFGAICSVPGCDGGVIRLNETQNAIIGYLTLMRLIYHDADDIDMVTGFDAEHSPVHQTMYSASTDGSQAIPYDVMAALITLLIFIALLNIFCFCCSSSPKSNISRLRRDHDRSLFINQIIHSDLEDSLSDDRYRDHDYDQAGQGDFRLDQYL